MHWLCILLGHRYDVRANYNDATNNYDFIFRACTRCGKMLIDPTNIEPKETAAPTKTRKPRAKKPAAINP